ncbi:MAG: CvpA family protein [Gammaproteobacteria bacterium]|nr:CvpA family protein [Gammaproteobacteria bacterium]
MIDYIIIGVVAISALIGLFRGFFPELISLLSWIVAIWSGWNFSHVIEPYLAGKIGSPALELWVARGIIFVGVLLVFGLLGQLIALLIKKTGLSGTDRALGLAFGVARGAVILGIAVLFARMIDLDQEPWWQASRVIPYGEGIASTLHSILPEQVSQHLPAVEQADTTAGEPAG